MYNDIRKWVEVCLDCQMKKTSPKEIYSIALPFVVDRPMEVIGIDIY